MVTQAEPEAIMAKLFGEGFQTRGALNHYKYLL